MLEGWTIYDHPLDYPQHFVARRWTARDGEVMATAEMYIGETLAEVRELLPPGLVCIPRLPADDPAIVECWL
ncbi:MAG: hypothetical protein IT481_08715 [Gammaproteobacteria bacterium]|nr:hypothetical protein [Gammaproteobacteria bacterium]